MKIRTEEEAKDILRIIDKHSEGWARVTTEDVPIGEERLEVWTARLSRSFNAVYYVYARKSHGKRLYREQVPDYVRQYLTARQDGHMVNRMDLSVESFKNLTSGRHGILRVTRGISEITLFVTFQVKHQRKRTCQGIQVGAEVGESGFGPTEFLPFPTTEKAVYDAIERVVSEARNDEIETGWARDEEDATGIANRCWPVVRQLLGEK